jgi:hypothetical protein
MVGALNLFTTNEVTLSDMRPRPARARADIDMTVLRTGRS